MNQTRSDNRRNEPFIKPEDIELTSTDKWPTTFATTDSVVKNPFGSVAGLLPVAKTLPKIPAITPQQEQSRACVGAAGYIAPAIDYAIYYFDILSRSLAETPLTRPLWVKSIGRGHLRAVTSAGRIFVHIPKTAGISLSSLLYGRHLNHYTISFWRSAYGAYIENIPSFSVIRHPIHRLISSYKMLQNQGTDTLDINRYWAPRLTATSFEHFLEVVDNHPLNYWEQSHFLIDDHDIILVDRIFTLDENYLFPSELQRWLNVPHIPRLNVAKPMTVSVECHVEKNIRRRYARDFEIYDKLVARGGWAELRGQRI